jgi:hypothetical protein
MPMIQITDAIPPSVLAEDFSARQALIGLKVMADDRTVQGLRALNPNLPRLPDVYEIAGRDMFDALWDANRPEHAIYWKDVIQPHLFRIPHRCAKVMRQVHIKRTPYLAMHPLTHLVALGGLEFLLDFDEIAACFAGNPDQERPPTCFLPVPRNRIVTLLRRAHRSLSADYWQRQDIGFLPIHESCCQLYDS